MTAESVNGPLRDVANAAHGYIVLVESVIQTLAKVVVCAGISCHSRLFSPPEPPGEPEHRKQLFTIIF